MAQVEKPIFIGGIRRSGTSLMRAIIGSHPDVAMLEYDVKLFASYYQRYKHVDLEDPELRHRVFSLVLRNPKMQSMEHRLDEDALWRSIAEQQIRSWPAFIQAILMNYADMLGRPRWGLKTPGNEFFADLIFTSYEAPKMIHMVRDARDVAVSIQSRQMPYHIVADGFWWSHSVQSAQQNRHKYADDYLVVQYEHLIEKPEATIHQICEVVELTYHKDMLDIAGFVRNPQRNTSFQISSTVSKGKFHQQGVGRYQSKLSSVEIAFYNRIIYNTYVSDDYCPSAQRLTTWQVVRLQTLWITYIAFALRYRLFYPLGMYRYQTHTFSARIRLKNALLALRKYIVCGR